MAKQVKTTVPSAWIVNSNDRGRKSIKKGKVYLSDKEEFQIELYNPLQDCVLADIKLNGNSISKSGLVLNPGQRFYLDCFIDDKKKFIFDTYEVDDTDETQQVIAKNGLLEVFFYKESVVTLNNWSNRLSKIVIEKHYPAYPWYPWSTTNPYTVYYGNGITNTNSLNSGLVTTTTNTGNVYCSTGAIDLTNLKSTNSAYYSNTMPISSNFTQTSFSSEKSLSIETGRVEKGSKSKQKFESVDMDFDNYYIASTIVQLLPDSRKPVETKDLMKHSEYVNQQHDVFDLLQKLSDLHKQNVLTDEEFKEKKDEILSKI